MIANVKAEQGAPLCTVELAYSGVMQWARRYCPEVVLGVLLVDELEEPISVKAEVVDQGQKVTPEQSLDAFAGVSTDKAFAGINKAAIAGEEEVSLKANTVPEPAQAPLPTPEAKAKGEPTINKARAQELMSLAKKASVSLQALDALARGMTGKMVLRDLTKKEADEVAAALIDMIEAEEKE